MPAKARDVDSGKKGQISPLLAVDGVTPAGVDLHADSTESIAGPLASARPRYTHHRPAPAPAAVCLVSRTRLWRRGGGEPRASERRGGADGKPKSSDDSEAAQRDGSIRRRAGSALAAGGHVMGVTWACRGQRSRNRFSRVGMEINASRRRAVNCQQRRDLPLFPNRLHTPLLASRVRWVGLVLIRPKAARRPGRRRWSCAAGRGIKST